MPRSKKYTKRIFVVGTDRHDLYHLLSIWQTPDGSLYCHLRARGFGRGIHIGHTMLVVKCISRLQAKWFMRTRLSHRVHLVEF